MSTNVSVVAMKLVAALTPTASTHWETIDANAKTASLVMGTTAETYIPTSGGNWRNAASLKLNDVQT